MAHEADTCMTDRDADKSQPWPHDRGLAAVVIAGAGARGAFEAGALEVLLPALFGASLRDVALLGTSAGAVNAALWAQYATPGTSLEAVGRKVCTFWEELSADKVYKPLVASVPRKLHQLIRGEVTGLLDTRPLFEHAAATIKVTDIASNVAANSVGGVGVVATTCPQDGTGGRSRVFLQVGAQFQLPRADCTSSIDYVPAALTHEHILASAAIPTLFPAVQVAGKGNYYCDGGVRLNTPMEPALELGATRLAIASSHATKYPPPVQTEERPDVVDLSAQAIHSVLADGLIEDLRSLKRINHIVRQAAARGVDVLNPVEQRPYRDVPFVAAAPEPGELAKLAREEFSRLVVRPSQLFRRLEYRLIEAAIAGFGRGAGNDELLSYLFFDPKFAKTQTELGRVRAREALGQPCVRTSAAPQRRASAEV